MGGLLVLKLGGSLLEAGRLPAIVNLIAARERPLVVVPGGGPFADAVRAAQRAHGFDDKAAHRMALFAMHQMAHLIAAASPLFAPAATPDDFARLLAGGLVPVWLPEDMAGEAEDVPASWDMTSDGLAAWLAARLPGAEVALVKSCRVDPDAALGALAAAQVIDPLFAGLVARHHLRWSVVGADDAPRLARLLALGSGASGEPH